MFQWAGWQHVLKAMNTVFLALCWSFAGFIQSFSCCTLSGSGADGSDGAAPELGILEDGYFPALGSEMEDLPQNWVRWEPPAAAQ